MDYRHICTAGMISHHDLLTVHEALEAGDTSPSIRVVFFRHLILEIANIADLSAISGQLYKEHPELGSLYQDARREFDFCKYLRNIYVGHFVPELTEKLFEWQPYANALLGSIESNRQFGISWFALETAINTYADPKDGHKIFPTDTDLNYPPDQTRFFNFLGDSALKAIKYSALLVETTRTYISVPDLDAQMLELAKIAGDTDFIKLTKKKR